MSALERIIHPFKGKEEFETQRVKEEAERYIMNASMAFAEDTYNKSYVAIAELKKPVDDMGLDWSRFLEYRASLNLQTLFKAEGIAF